MLVRVLAIADAGEPGVAEGVVVGPAEIAAARRNRAGYAIVFEWFENLAHDVGRFRRTKHTRAAHAAGAGINVEIAAELFIAGFRVLDRTEMLFDVSLRSQQAFFLPTPQRDANGAAR